MKYYDFKKAKKIIKDTLKKSKNLASASLCMIEDQGYTSEEIWRDNKFTKKFLAEDEVAGILGSHWATPTLVLYFKNDTEKHFSCFTEKE